MSDLGYFLSSLRKNFSPASWNCPSCGSPDSETIDRKWFVTALRRCAKCRLLFRVPTTSERESVAYYRKDYQQGFTTSLPSASELAILLETQFDGHEKSYQNYLRVLSALGVTRGQKLFDYGCSWGYGSHQLKSLGVEVDAYEISERRADFAREKLRIRVVDPSSAAQGSYDVVFSVHVVEHVPSVSRFLAAGLRLLKPAGLLIGFTPNGCTEYQKANPSGWRSSWGRDHPQLIDSEYLRHEFPGCALVASSPYPAAGISSWDGRKETLLSLDGSELVFAVRKRG